MKKINIPKKQTNMNITYSKYSTIEEAFRARFVIFLFPLLLVFSITIMIYVLYGNEYIETTSNSDLNLKVSHNIDIPLK